MKNEEECMEMSDKSFRREALELSDVSTNNKEQRHSVWLFLALLCAMHYTNDPQ